MGSSDGAGLRPVYPRGDLSTCTLLALLFACVSSAACRTRLPDTEVPARLPDAGPQCTPTACPGGFRAPEPLGGPSLTGANGIAAGDFDGDGHADLVVSGDGGLDLFLGRGDGSFAAPVRALSGDFLWYPLPVDLDGDRRLDLVVADDEGLLFARGDGHGGFTSTRTIYDHFLIFVAAGDLDGDGRPEVVATNGQLAVFSLGQKGSLALRSSLLLPQVPTARAVLADANGDGKLDALVGTNPNVDGIGELALYRGRGDNSFDAPVYLGRAIKGGSCANPVLGDFDEDGQVDVAIAAGLTLDILRLDGHGGARLVDTHALMPDCPEVATADFDGDHHLDLAVTERTAPTLLLLHGNGDGTFREVGRCPLCQRPENGLLARDFDGDGQAELALPVVGLGLFAGSPFDALLIRRAP